MASNLRMQGIYSFYKPKGPTSYDLVEKIKKITKEKRVGHAGTLDPLADGVLIVAIGREFTKKITLFVDKEKEYLAKIKLGWESSTDDEQGEKKEINSSEAPKISELREKLSLFQGEIDQVPPDYSAIKVCGKRAYALSRKGIKINLKARKVLIKEIELLRYKYPEVDIRVVSGPGAYIRSLARDLGRELSTGAYLIGLTRTRIGNHLIKDSLDISEIKDEDINRLNNISLT